MYYHFGILFLASAWASATLSITTPPSRLCKRSHTTFGSITLDACPCCPVSKLHWRILLAERSEAWKNVPRCFCWQTILKAQGAWNAIPNPLPWRPFRGLTHTFTSALMTSITKNIFQCVKNRSAILNRMCEFCPDDETRCCLLRSGECWWPPVEGALGLLKKPSLSGDPHNRQIQKRKNWKGEICFLESSQWYDRPLTQYNRSRCFGPCCWVDHALCNFI